MPAISKTGSAVSAVKTAAAVMVLALFASVAGFLTSAGTSPAAAQETCVTTTAIVNGVSVSTTKCYTPTTTTYSGNLLPGNVWCSNTFGNFFTGQLPHDANLIAFHRTWVAIGILVGVEYVPEGCGVRDSFTSDCVVYQGAQWRFDAADVFDPIPGSPELGFDPRLAPEPYHQHCFTTDHTIKDDAVLAAVIADVCKGLIPKPKIVEFYAEQSLASDLFNSEKSEIVTLDGDVLDFDCCPNRLQHNDGDPGKPCHSHLPEPCQADTEVTYDRINGDGHTWHTVAPCPDTDVTPVGATFDIVLDYPRRGQGVFATIGGALAPVTFTATAKNFVCRAPSQCGNTGQPFPTYASFDLNLEGVHGYLEGRYNQFEVVGRTFDGSRNGIDRWGRLDYSREIVAYFYRATYTNPDQRVAISIVAPQGTYQYWMRETEHYWVDDPDHPDGGYPQSRTVTNLYPAPMTARLVDVDDNLITADTDPYYSRDNGRVELRIAGFQPVFD